MALGSPRDEDYLLHELPMEKGLYFLCAKAIQNGAHPIWSSDAAGVTKDATIDRAREILRFFNGRRKDHERNDG